MLVGCGNVILGKRWNVQKIINPIYYYEISRFNGVELYKTYSFYKSE